MTTVGHLREVAHANAAKILNEKQTEATLWKRENTSIILMTTAHEKRLEVLAANALSRYVNTSHICIPLMALLRLPHSEALIAVSEPYSINTNPNSDLV